MTPEEKARLDIDEKLKQMKSTDQSIVLRCYRANSRYYASTD